MSRPHSPPRARAALAAALAALALAACGRDEISHYRVPKSPAAGAPALAPSHAVAASAPAVPQPAPAAGSPSAAAEAGGSR